MMYVYAGIAILVLFLIGRIIRWWNLPEVAKARTERVKARQEARTERLKLRRRRWHRNDIKEQFPQDSTLRARLLRGVETGEYDYIKTPDEKRWSFFRRFRRG